MTIKYKIEFNKLYLKDLEKIPKTMRVKITQKIQDLSLNPRPESVKKLKGSKNPILFRLRIGNYRVVYTIEDQKLVVLLIAIGHRREIYRSF